MAVTAAQVKELREKTGAGIMDAKRALVETDGNMEAAAELLREKDMEPMTPDEVRQMLKIKAL